MTSTLKPIKVGPFNLGVNNRLPDTELVVPKVGAFLRSGVNVDLTTPGTLKRRQGFDSALNGTDCHSLFARGDEAYVVDGTALYALSGDPGALVKTAVRTGLTPGQRLSYTMVNDDILYTDGSTLRRLSGAQDFPVSVPMLSPEPAVTAVAGSLPEATYQVCFAYVDANFQQSGSTTPIAVTGTGIAISNLPAAFPSDVAGVMVYMTPPNGDLLMLAQVLTAPQTTLNITSPPTLSGQCPTLLLRPMPGGSIVRHNNGRLLVASGKNLFYSEPFSNLYDPAKNFIPFSTTINVVESLTAGFYVATDDKTFYFGGDITNTPARVVLPYGGIAGTGGAYPDKLRCWWMSPRGLVQGDDAGNVKNVQEDNIAMNPAQLGASMFRERDGIKQVVTSLFGSDTTGATAYSYMQAEIVRKGITL